MNIMYTINDEDIPYDLQSIIGARLSFECLLSKSNLSECVNASTADVHLRFFCICNNDDV